MTKKKPRKIGRPLKHGGYSLAVRSGTLPEDMNRVRRYLEDIRQGLIHDHGGDEDAIPAGRRILIDRVISKLGVLRVIEEHLGESGILVGDTLAPILRQNYLAWANSIRLDLVALGLDPDHPGGKPLTPAELLDLAAEEGREAQDSAEPGHGAVQEKRSPKDEGQGGQGQKENEEKGAS
ncbi:MAG: hypothetical protein SCM96_02315 [Acidobacteriota bacterium]|nr:hypothetical protein [Acidobacteriota bacterium]